MTFFAALRMTVLAALLLLATPARALDVTHYRLEIDLRADDEALAGAATLDILLDAADVGAGAVPLDFVGLEVTGLFVDGLADEAWSRDGAVLSVPLPPGAAAGDLVQVEVRYEGVPTPYVAPWGTWGVVRSQDRIFTVNVTEGARHWFPCDDRLDDKASVELLVSVPDPWLVAAPGTLLAQEPDGDARTRFHWSADWPLPTYLIHFAAGPYILTTEEHDGVPYQTWLHPTLHEDAADTFAHAPAAMEMLTARYGPYPFPKVGFDEIDLGGAVENPSCISIGTQILVPDQVYEDVIAHELSHTWFQGVVTVASWDDVWLSEGMATYHEALYHEHVHGPGTLAEYTDSLGISYRAMAEMAEGFFPLSKPESLWGVTTYRKGALVLHTLSHLLGREVFDQALVDYLEAFAWGNATTEDFRQVLESTAGRDLDSFFDEWVHGTGYPQFGLGWRHDPGAGTVDVAVDQRQPEDWPIFRSVPLEVELAFSDGGVQREVMELTDRLTIAAFAVPAAPTSVTLDPDHWILKTVDPMDFPNVGPEDPPTGDAVGPEGPPTGDAAGPGGPPTGSGGCDSGASAPPAGLLFLLLLAVLVPARLRHSLLI